MSDKRIIRALVIDDEKIVRDFLMKFLEFEGIEAKDAEDGYKAIALVEQEEFDVVFVEVRMPEIDGLQTFRKLREIKPNIKYVMMSGNYVDGRLDEALREGAERCFKKPFDIEELKSLVGKLRSIKAQ